MTWFLCLGRCAGSLQRRSQRLPALRGSNQRVATPDTYFRPPGRPCRMESQTVSLIPFRIPWIATAVGCQSTHARLRSPRLLQGNRPSCLQKLLDLEPSRATGPRVYNRSFHLNQRVKPTKTNETFNTGRTSDHVTSKLEKKPQHKGCR